MVTLKLSESDAMWLLLNLKGDPMGQRRPGKRIKDALALAVRRPRA